MQTKRILEEYKLALQKENSPLYLDILEYTKGARCTFPSFKCNSECNFKEGITLKRII